MVDVTQLGGPFYPIGSGGASVTSLSSAISIIDETNLLASEAYTDAAVAAVIGGGTGTPGNGVVSGLGVFYVSGLTFGMSAGSANINGVLVQAAAQTVVLATADATNPRIDVLYVNDVGVFDKITGTPAANPSQPTVDPTSQLYLAFALVPALAATLPAFTTETIYDEGAEWTATTSGSGFTVDSTNNPNTGTKDIEGTSVSAGAYVKFVDPTPTSFDGDGSLLISVRSKATWNTKRSLLLQWFVAGVAKGVAVTLKDGSFSFISSTTGVYQALVIAKPLFAIPTGTIPDEFRITAAGTGGTFGFYIDPIKLQTVASSGGGTGSTSGKPTEQFVVALGDETTVVSTGNNKTSWTFGYDFTIDEIYTELGQSQSSSGSVTVDVNKNGSTIFSTKPSIEANESSSLTGTAAVISVPTSTKGNIFTVDIDAAGTGAKGLKLVVIGRRT